MSLPKRVTPESNDQAYRKQKNSNSDYHNRPRGIRRDEIDRDWKTRNRRLAVWRDNGVDVNGAEFTYEQYKEALDISYDTMAAERKQMEIDFPKGQKY